MKMVNLFVVAALLLCLHVLHVHSAADDKSDADSRPACEWDMNYDTLMRMARDVSRRHTQLFFRARRRMSALMFMSFSPFFLHTDRAVLRSA